MRILGKVFIGIVSASLFVILILLATIKFELLDKSFLFGSFEKHNVYKQLPAALADSLQNDPNLSEEEGMAYAEFVKNISPQEIKRLIESNLTQVLDFLNGQSKDVVISFSLPGVGFENASGIRWSLTQLPDKNLQEKIKSLNGIGNTLIIVGVVILIVLAGLIFLSGRVILLSSGIFLTISSLIIKLILLIIGNELTNGQEPSQKILGLLSSSLFSDITTTWLIAGGTLILFWLASFIKSPLKRSEQKS